MLIDHFQNQVLFDLEYHIGLQNPSLLASFWIIDPLLWNKQSEICRRGIFAIGQV